MPARLITPLLKEFILEKTDILLNNEGEPTKVTIRQATQAQHTLRADKYANLVQEINKGEPDVNRYITRFSQFELMRTETYLTMVGCNLLDPDGDPVFKFKQNKNGQMILAMNESEFNDAWGMLPEDVAEEIWEKVREVNIRWKTGGED
jgi:hypothetical protein